MSRDEHTRLRANLQSEVDGAAVYTAIAEAERDPKLAAVYRQLAAIEGRHARFWASQLAGGGRRVALKPSARARTLAWIARRLGPQAVLPLVAADEARGGSGYSAQPDAVAEGIAGDERSHARVIRAATTVGGGLPGASLATLEGRHRGGGGNVIRAAVLGANDGLASNLSLVMGVAGAGAGHKAIVLAGVAGLIAGACSMAIGEWLSVSSSRELYQAQIATEAEELRRSPEEEKQELALIYQAKGLDEAEAAALADRLLADETAALDTLVREELGIDPENLGGSAWGAAAVSFGLFAGGAVVPLTPFLLLDGPYAVGGSLVLSTAALGLIGAATSLFTARSPGFSAMRQMAAGLAAAGVTFAIGRLAGAVVA
jgi:VIT1/CCC1 family predicted Fe2+/Mn2+ transporter